MEKSHQTSDTADCTPTHYEWNKEMKRPVSNTVSFRTSFSNIFQTCLYHKEIVCEYEEAEFDELTEREEDDSEF